VKMGERSGTLIARGVVHLRSVGLWRDPR
jgi:hypothetical protein